MKKSTIALLVVGALMLMFTLLLTTTYFSITNREISLRTQVEAKQKVCESYYSKMFTEIKEIAQVSEQYKESFKEIYPAIMQGRYGNARGGALMSWVQESNPNFDIKLYDKLATVIETNRDNFQIQQEQLIDLKRAYDTYIQTFPNRLFVTATPIKISIIVTDVAKEAFEKEQDQVIDVFAK